jgi:hypothetical protein
VKQIPFVDIEALTAEVNEQFGDWGPEIEVTQDVINRFAEVTGDHQWIHVDVERAKASPLGTTVAHGFLTMSLLPVLQPPLGFEVVGYGAAINYGGDSYRFPNFVPSGSRVHARSRLAAVERKGTGTLITQAYEVWVVGAPKAALVGTLKVLYQ